MISDDDDDDEDGDDDADDDDDDDGDYAHRGLCLGFVECCQRKRFRRTVL